MLGVARMLPQHSVDLWDPECKDVNERKMNQEKRSNRKRKEDKNKKSIGGVIAELT
jgi:hypothetical protein